MSRNQNQYDDLAVAFNKGSKEAFSRIYKLLQRRIFSFAKCFVNKEDAADITADTFLKLWKLHDRFINYPDIRAFLYITARNASIDVIRHKKMAGEKQLELVMSEPHYEEIIIRS